MPAGRAKLPDDQVTPAALRKRRQRQKAIETDGIQKYREARAKEAQDYRDKKKKELEDQLRQDGDPDAAEGSLAARAALERARREAVKEVSKGLQELYSAKIKTAEEAQAKAPELIAKAREISERKAFQVEKAVNKEVLAKQLFDHSQKYEKDQKRNKFTSVASARRYVDRLLALQRLMGKSDKAVDLENFRNANRVLKLIFEEGRDHRDNKPWAPNTKIGYLTAVVGVLKRAKGFDEPYQKLSEELTKRSTKVEEARRGNLLTEREAENYIRWPDLQAYLAAYRRGEIKLNKRQAAVVALYLDVAPRRAEDYMLMRLAIDPTKAQYKKLDEPRSGDEDKPTNGDFNWLVVKDGKITEMILNRYKTDGDYGTWRRGDDHKDKIPAPLKKELKALLKEAKSKNGDYLFPVLKGENQGKAMEGAFSNFVRDSFGKLTGKKPGVNSLRHSKISHFLDRRQIPEQERIDLAKEMGHSTNTQGKYLRLDAVEGFEAFKDKPPDGAPKAKAKAKAKGQPAPPAEPSKSKRKKGGSGGRKSIAKAKRNALAAAMLEQASRANG